MRGQWVGTFETTYPQGIIGPDGGTLVLDIDERSHSYDGIAHLDYSDNVFKLPPMEIWLEASSKEHVTAIASTNIAVVDQDTGLLAHWDTVKDKYPGVVMPQRLEGTATLHSDHLEISWSSDLGTTGRCLLPKSRADQPSDLVAAEMNWDNYKTYVNELEGRNRLFRGQNKQWRLRTAFHREGRANVLRYMVDDLSTLHRTLSAKTKHFFNMKEYDQVMAFLNLVQHHGYPTPLLDWTYSPYVAAFFAFRGIGPQQVKEAEANQKARIFVFDHARWRKDLLQISQVGARFPHVSLVDPMALENDRCVPQQAALVNTTVDDIETYMAKKARPNQPPYLMAIDIPWSERDKVVNELHYMGITAASMFPGLDGACEELKERNFWMSL